MPVEARFDEALELLAGRGVEFIVVGGIAAILQGVVPSQGVTTSTPAGARRSK